MKRSKLPYKSPLGTSVADTCKWTYPLDAVPPHSALSHHCCASDLSTRQWNISPDFPFTDFGTNSPPGCNFSKSRVIDTMLITHLVLFALFGFSTALPNAIEGTASDVASELRAIVTGSATDIYHDGIEDGVESAPEGQGVEDWDVEAQDHQEKIGKPLPKPPKDDCYMRCGIRLSSCTGMCMGTLMIAEWDANWVGCFDNCNKQIVACSRAVSISCSLPLFC